MGALFEISVVQLDTVDFPGKPTFHVLAKSGRYEHCGRRGMIGGLQGCQFRTRAGGFKMLRTHFEARLHIYHGSNRCRREKAVSKLHTEHEPGWRGVHIKICRVGSSVHLGGPESGPGQRLIKC